MRGRGRPGRGERARVEQRVRAVIGNESGAGGRRPTRHRAPNILMRLAARSGVNLDASRSAAVATAVVLLVVALVVGAWVLSSRPRAVPMPAASDSVPDVARSSVSGGGPSPPPASSTTAGSIVVDVAGKVRRPGLYRLTMGARIDDAVRAAGGALPGVDLSTLNLAARLGDGQQVAVGVAAAPGSVGGAGAAGASGAGTAAGPVHLNTATVEELEALPGVGPVLAQHIVDYRAAHGSFASVEQLNEVPGIGDAKFAALRDAVTL